jgi:hypothetical protein
MWDLLPESDPSAPQSGSSGSGLDTSVVTETWWGASLAEWDNRYYDLRDDETNEVMSVPLHVLSYDANPAMGYPDVTASEVVFVGEHLIFDVALQMTSVFKREGDSWLPSDVDLTEDGGGGGEQEERGSDEQVRAHDGDSSKETLEEVVIGTTRGDYETFFDKMFSQAFSKMSSAGKMYSSTSATKQRAVAEIFGRARLELIDSLWNKTKDVDVVTVVHVQEIISEVGVKLEEIKRDVFGSTDMV